MAAAREPKKSESIEIRLSHKAKAEFMERCQHERASASEAIRSMIALSARNAPAGAALGARWRTAVAVAAGMALGAGAAAPALAHASQPSREAFAALDRNHDGVLSYIEFSAR